MKKRKNLQLVKGLLLIGASFLIPITTYANEDIGGKIIDISSPSETELFIATKEAIRHCRNSIGKWECYDIDIRLTANETVQINNVSSPDATELFVSLDSNVRHCRNTTGKWQCYDIKGP